eukprot:1198207-Rhodomonas_salina.2
MAAGFGARAAGQSGTALASYSPARTCIRSLVLTRRHSATDGAVPCCLACSTTLVLCYVGCSILLHPATSTAVLSLKRWGGSQAEMLTPLMRERLFMKFQQTLLAIWRTNNMRKVCVRCGVLLALSSSSCLWCGVVVAV